MSTANHTPQALDVRNTNPPEPATVTPEKVNRNRQVTSPVEIINLDIMVEENTKEGMSEAIATLQQAQFERDLMDDNASQLTDYSTETMEEEKNLMTPSGNKTNQNPITSPGDDDNHDADRSKEKDNDSDSDDSDYFPPKGTGHVSDFENLRSGLLFQDKEDGYHGRNVILNIDSLLSFMIECFGCRRCPSKLTYENFQFFQRGIAHEITY